ncbi:2-dehydro-3-deoxyphosphogluconate aldolase/(4S)-4-hydroxy-2-oxoglutarate aldolase [Kitasatospora sp. SolWspMP-SS2h]|uniref:bifunctional 4-hydroxy-2-oxoglutarate aldolase/2-dehydro-3-deoxy-phosphogluconate aldolase n=1 Tax=Kitasatospora sp. SolWspMP-SS2h TaxID=1305729 RepID=UPI000DBA23AE|nr:bifunctional 4-hydroxy-2-oxoglutarate aldolase/2-dehydro-3-deoxy-phosphogluconate aldolase [Kitasatospora sp. SolWspMP-SS2h]RAJ38480.1 2-dehydro-3-deoxyphosphogluconate aldolase/(4S)-4-hydroxy-2-oxoglutarate aldolase [Kitasatospora sp. SolWspMP-SS2h]
MDLLTELTDRKVLAVVRADTPDLAVACLRTLAGAGITALEVSLTTPGALDAIARARADSPPDVLIGAGTVLTAEHAELAAAAGASFAVTPGLTPGAPRSTALGLPLLCGALTPTEVLAALDAGATAVKVFPAATHGPGYLRDLLAPLPHAPLIAIGGIDADAAPRYLAAGARVVGVGSPLLGDAGRGGSLTALAERAARLLRAVGHRATPAAAR